MSEPDISTLARRLAEQNNVDWRALSGSGPEGKVVERDVLDFLARVMAGDEATNPTPEPLPAGMEAWPDKDLDDLRASVGEAGTLHDLRDELGRSVRSDDEGAMAVGEPSADSFGDVESVPFGSAETAGGGHAANDANPVGVDEDIFLFDDDAADGSVADGATEPGGWAVSGGSTMEPYPAAAATGAAAASDDLDDLLVAGDELDGEAGDATSPSEPGSAFAASSSDAIDEGDDSASDFGELEPAGFDAPDDSFGFGQDHDTGLGTSGAESDSGAEGDSAWGAAEQERTVPEEAIADASDSAWGTNISLGGDHDSFGGSGAGNDGDAAEDLWGEPQVASGSGGLWSDDTGANADPDADTVSDADTDSDTDTDDITADYASDISADCPTDNAPATDNAADIAADNVAQVAAGELGLESDEVAATDAIANLPLARSATILRRHIDLSALASSQLSVGNELGFDEPLGAAPFLLRAVAKAAGALDVAEAHVALAVLGDGLTLRRVSDAAQRSFASLVSELAEPAIEEDEPRLVAADLSSLDLDEALLDLDVPVVTLGRILYDNQRGAYRSILTLTGDVKPEAGAKLLARVAELLDAPVRLVL